jgi:hypothetical protein
VMSTIVKYPKGKYVFLKPETMDWIGGIRLPGLEEYVEEVLEEFAAESERAQVKEFLTAERSGSLDDAGTRLLATVRDQYQEMLEAELMRQVLDTDGSGDVDLAARQLLGDARKKFEDKGSSFEEWMRTMLSDESASRLSRARQRFEALLDAEEKYQIGKLLDEEKAGAINSEELGKLDRLNLARLLYGEELEVIVSSRKLNDKRYAALAEARSKVAGDQREVLLNTWIMNMKENEVLINENESCKAVKRPTTATILPFKPRKAAKRTR